MPRGPRLVIPNLKWIPVDLVAGNDREAARQWNKIARTCEKQLGVPRFSGSLYAIKDSRNGSVVAHMFQTNKEARAAQENEAAAQRRQRQQQWAPQGPTGSFPGQYATAQFPLPEFDPNNISGPGNGNTYQPGASPNGPMALSPMGPSPTNYNAGNFNQLVPNGTTMPLPQMGFPPTNNSVGTFQQPWPPSTMPIQLGPLPPNYGGKYQQPLVPAQPQAPHESPFSLDVAQPPHMTSQAEATSEAALVAPQQLQISELQPVSVAAPLPWEEMPQQEAPVVTSYDGGASILHEANAGLDRFFGEVTEEMVLREEMAVAAESLPTHDNSTSDELELYDLLARELEINFSLQDWRI